MALLSLQNSPIRQVRRAIWTMLEASFDFCDAVKPGNRIKYGDSRAPEKPLLQAADAPQVAVLHLGLKPHPENTSNSSRLLSLWSIETTTLTRKDDDAADLEWIVYRALTHWQTHLRDALTWENAKFVTLFRPTAIDEEIVARRRLRAPEGWTSIWAGECDMWFRTLDVKA